MQNPGSALLWHNAVGNLVGDCVGSGVTGLTVGVVVGLEIMGDSVGAAVGGQNPQSAGQKTKSSENKKQLSDTNRLQPRGSGAP